MKNFTDFLFESSIKDMTPDEYRNVLKNKCPDDYPPEVDDVPADREYHNPPEEEHTSDRKSCGNIPWIEYWRRLTNFQGQHLKCTFCGEEIFFDIESPACTSWRMEHPEERNYHTVDDYQAEGGHYHKNGKDNTDGYIIIPVCKSCNAKNDDFILRVKENNKFVQEIGASEK